MKQYLASIDFNHLIDLQWAFGSEQIFQPVFLPKLSENYLSQISNRCLEILPRVSENLWRILANKLESSPKNIFKAFGLFHISDGLPKIYREHPESLLEILVKL